MNEEELDILWFKAMRQSVEENKPFIRYHFAALVAEAERVACAKIAHDSVSKVCEEAAAVLRQLHEENERLRDAVKAEREACAKVCEEEFPGKPGYEIYAEEAAQVCAAAIRARGEQEIQR